MKHLKLSVISATTLLMITGAFAQTADSTKPDSSAMEQSTKAEGSDHGIGKRDANENGAIDLEEFGRMENMKAADTNGDGTLAQDEIEAMVLKRMVARQAERMSRRLDVDGDGTVTLSEIDKQRAKRFALLDRNDDGKLERSEMWSHGKGKFNKMRHFGNRQGQQHRHGG